MSDPRLEPDAAQKTTEPAKLVGRVARIDVYRGPIRTRYGPAGRCVVARMFATWSGHGRTRPRTGSQPATCSRLHMSTRRHRPARTRADRPGSDRGEPNVFVAPPGIFGHYCPLRTLNPRVRGSSPWRRTRDQ